MAYARRDLDWEKQFELAIDGSRARKIRDFRKTESDACSMCGDLCALKIVKEVLGEKEKKSEVFILHFMFFSIFFISFSNNLQLNSFSKLMH